MKERRELPSLGAISGIRGVEELWLFLADLLAPLGFKKERSTFSYCCFSGQLQQDFLKIEFTIRTSSHYFGSREHMGKVRTFQGLDMKISVAIKTQTRLVVGTKIGGVGKIREVLLWLTKKKHAQLYVSTQPVLANRDIFIYDKKWSEVFLNEPIVIGRLENLTDESMNLLSWSLKIIPKKLTFSRRFSRLSMLTTKLFLRHLQDVMLIAKCADNAPTSCNIELTKLEQLQQDDPKKAMWYSAMIALSVFMIAFFLIIGLPFLLLLFISGKL